MIASIEALDIFFPSCDDGSRVSQSPSFVLRHCFWGWGDISFARS
jgi:hypothetical protein